MSPSARRTHWPSLRSMAGKTIKARFGSVTTGSQALNDGKMRGRGGAAQLKCCLVFRRVVAGDRVGEARELDDHRAIGRETLRILSIAARRQEPPAIFFERLVERAHIAFERLRV